MDIEAGYRSKNATFMRQLKKAIRLGIDDEYDQELAWTYMERRVIIDDLHQFAIKELDTEEPVEMGHGDLNAHLMVLTTRPLRYSKEGKALAETIVASGKFDHVYYTAKYKMKTAYKSDLPVFEKLLDSEIKILKPKAILTFGEVLPIGNRQVEEYLGVPVIQTHFLSEMLQDDEELVKQIKNEVWQDVKKIRQYYKK